MYGSLTITWIVDDQLQDLACTIWRQREGEPKELMYKDTTRRYAWELQLSQVEDAVQAVLALEWDFPVATRLLL